jgi:aspartyl-tRNA(Asn)/glutamyl-tRNA(Gln) amidotransferase subunit A
MSPTRGLLSEASAGHVAGLVRDGTVTSTEVVEACLARIDKYDPVVRAFVTVLKEDALKAARVADEKTAATTDLPPLHGVPVTIKDTFLLPGTPTTVGSTLLADYQPAGHPASCLDRLIGAGAILLGKTNVGSGMSLTHHSDRSRLAPPRNPYDLDRTPGGSSSGSAVAVSLGMGFASVGTDLGGSIRNPASFTGVVGMKPTYGRVSLHGDIFGAGTRYEHVGPLTRTVEDAALLLEVLAGYDSRDPRTADEPVPAYRTELAKVAVDGLRIGTVIGGGPNGSSPDVLKVFEEATSVLRTVGLSVKQVTLPRHDESMWHFLTLFDEWKMYDDSATEPESVYDAYIELRLRQGRDRALRYLDESTRILKTGYDELFRTVDVLVLTTAPITARPFDELRMVWRESEMETFDLHLMNTWMFNITGHPAISVPGGFDSDGLPVGLQFVGKHFDEVNLLAVAALYERERGQLPPPPLLLAEGRRS